MSKFGGRLCPVRATNNNIICIFEKKTVSTGYKIQEPEGIYFLTLQIVGWVNFLHKIPVRSGIVQYPEYYLYSSAGNYADEENIFDLSVLSFFGKTVK